MLNIILNSMETNSQLHVVNVTSTDSMADFCHKYRTFYSYKWSVPISVCLFAVAATYSTLTFV